MENRITELKKRIAGNVLTAEDAAYEKARKTLFNPNARPAVVIQVSSDADVAEAIRFAHNNSLALSVKSGGHNGEGLSTNTGGVVIDLALLNNVEVLDEAAGLVRIGTGAHWGDVAKQLHDHGLAISSGDTKSVGVGGLTLGGGIGWMVRKFGLTIDNTVAADIVTADGRSLHLSDTENQDLFWAIRGGGGNFGVVTALEIRAVHIADIVGGTLTYDFDDRQKVLEGWADYMRTAPEELTCIANIVGGFPGMPPQCTLTVCYVGNDEQAANEALKPLLSLGKVTSNTVKKMPYHEILEEIKEPAGMKVRVTNGFIKTLDQEVIGTIVSHYGQQGAPIIQIRTLGGAMARVPADATAFGHRTSEALVIVPSFVPIDMPDAVGEKTAAAAWEPLKRFADGAYLNFFSNSRDETIASAFPAETYKRLAHIKALYDPENIFKRTANIKPKA